MSLVECSSHCFFQQDFCYCWWFSWRLCLCSQLLRVGRMMKDVASFCLHCLTLLQVLHCKRETKASTRLLLRTNTQSHTDDTFVQSAQRTCMWSSCNFKIVHHSDMFFFFYQKLNNFGSVLVILPVKWIVCVASLRVSIAFVQILRTLCLCRKQKGKQC